METQEGTILIHRDVVETIIIKAVNEMGGKILITNYKGKLSGILQRLGAREESDDMEITMTSDGVCIRLYTLIMFGASIRKVTDQLVSRVKEEVLQTTGLKVTSITVVVTGIQSKQIAKRNIEIRF